MIDGTNILMRCPKAESGCLMCAHRYIHSYNKGCIMNQVDIECPDCIEYPDIDIEFIKEKEMQIWE